MWDRIITLFTEYIGDGKIMALFAAAFIYLLFAEKEREKRIVLLYVSLAAAALFFCPLFAAAAYHFLDDEIYYRILWIIPMTVIIAYAGVKLIGSLSQKWKKAAALLLSCGLIVISGKNVYENACFSPAENRFHVPQTVALVCDEIIVEGREVKAVFPSEMLPYVRQYTANICMPYGREMQVERWKNENPLYDAMEEEEIDCKKVAELAAAQGCYYIILHETKPLKGGFDMYNFTRVGNAAGYDIYLQDGVYLGLDYSYWEKS